MWGHVENIALDSHVEHSNNYIKQANRNVGPNLNDNPVNHICTVNHAEKGLRNLLTQIYKSIERISDSGEHTCCSIQQDLDVLLKRPVTTMCFQRIKTANTNEYVYKGKYAQEQYPYWYESTIISVVHIDYFMVGECVRFLFTSCEGSLNERVSAANE